MIDERAIVAVVVGSLLVFLLRSFLLPITEAFVGLWVRFYTWRLPTRIRLRRMAEIRSEVAEHKRDDLASGYRPAEIALHHLDRVLRGMGRDVVWSWSVGMQIMLRRPAVLRRRIWLMSVETKFLYAWATLRVLIARSAQADQVFQDLLLLRIWSEPIIPRSSLGLPRRVSTWLSHVVDSEDVVKDALASLEAQELITSYTDGCLTLTDSGIESLRRIYPPRLLDLIRDLVIRAFALLGVRVCPVCLRVLGWLSNKRVVRRD